MALGVSWMGWRRPAAPHGHQRRGYSGRTSERSRHVVVGFHNFFATVTQKNAKNCCIFAPVFPPLFTQKKEKEKNGRKKKMLEGKKIENSTIENTTKE